MERCRIVRYDENVTTYPFKVDATGDEFECERPKDDEGGVKFYFVLVDACHEKGYSFKSYCGSRVEGYDYDVAV